MRSMIPLALSTALLWACAHHEAGHEQAHNTSPAKDEAAAKSAHGGAHSQPHHAAHKAGSQRSHRRFRDPKKWTRVFDSKKRAGWQKANAVVKKLKLEPTDHVADIGAGTGYFTLPLARAVPQGRVYTIDIEQTMVTYAEERAKKAGLNNVVGAVAQSDDAKIPSPVDVVFLCNTYHHIGERKRYFERLATSLKPGGRVVIVDFKAGELDVGPPEKHRVLPDALDQEMRAAGYKRLDLDEKTLPYQYIATYGR